MTSNIIQRIRDMGYDRSISVKEIDEFVDECIAFLKREQDMSPEIDLSDDMFSLEDARQKALLNKYCLTVQPL
jgi:hypothetical protein